LHDAGDKVVAVLRQSGHTKASRGARRKRDAAIRRAARAGLATREIGAEVRLSHTQVAKIINEGRRGR
jgi:hypothetical protein